MRTHRMTLMVLILLYVCHLGAADLRSGYVVGWGRNHSGAATGVPVYLGYSTGTVALAGQMLTNITAISAGKYHVLALREDGVVVGWGFNSSGQATGVSSPGTETGAGVVTFRGGVLSSITGIAAGWTHSLALKSDGTVVAWGDPQFGKTAVPEALSNVVAIATGDEHSLALRRDGTVTSWGQPTQMPSGLSNVVAIAACTSFFSRDMALKSDGTVIDWLIRGLGSSVPPGLTNVVAIASGEEHCLAVRQDGSVAQWGNSQFAKSGVPSGLSNVVAVAAGDRFSLALKSDGTLFAWGGGPAYKATVPAGLSNVVAIAAGSDYCLAITTNPAVAERFMKKEK